MEARVERGRPGSSWPPGRLLASPETALEQALHLVPTGSLALHHECHCTQDLGVALVLGLGLGMGGVGTGAVGMRGVFYQQ